MDPARLLRLCLWAAFSGFFLPRVSGTIPECAIKIIIEAEREKCVRYSSSDNLTLGCEHLWDNISCWPAANFGETKVLPCPIFFTYFTNFQGNVSRNCTRDGWSDIYPAPYPVACGYDPNTTITDQQTVFFYGTVKTGYTIGHSLSLIALTVAMLVLCFFRKLHCTRNYIHMHLFTSFILRAVAVFVKDFILFENGAEYCSIGSVGCKAAVVFFQYCIMANFFWLLVEGLYLHNLLVISFFSEKKYFWWYIVIGWGAPMLFILAWTVTRIHYENKGCWDLIVSPYWWIIKAPILVSIMVNFVLFICIIRILVQKLHSPDIGQNETSQYLRLAKSTLLLIPLFGIHYIIFAFFPDTVKNEVMYVKLVFELVLGSFQVSRLSFPTTLTVPPGVFQTWRLLRRVELPEFLSQIVDFNPEK